MCPPFRHRAFLRSKSFFWTLISYPTKCSRTCGFISAKHRWRLTEGGNSYHTAFSRQPLLKNPYTGPKPRNKAEVKPFILNCTWIVSAFWVSIDKRYDIFHLHPWIGWVLCPKSLQRGYDEDLPINTPNNLEVPWLDSLLAMRDLFF